MEMFLRIISLGFCFGETTYMQYGWNILDFVLVMSCVYAFRIDRRWLSHTTARNLHPAGLTVAAIYNLQGLDRHAH